MQRRGARHQARRCWAAQQGTQCSRRNLALPHAFRPQRSDPIATAMASVVVCAAAPAVAAQASARSTPAVHQRAAFRPACRRAQRAQRQQLRAVAQEQSGAAGWLGAGRVGGQRRQRPQAAAAAACLGRRAGPDTAPRLPPAAAATAESTSSSPPPGFVPVLTPEDLPKGGWVGGWVGLQGRWEVCGAAGALFLFDSSQSVCVLQRACSSPAWHCRRAAGATSAPARPPLTCAHPAPRAPREHERRGQACARRCASTARPCCSSGTATRSTPSRRGERARSAAWLGRGTRRRRHAAAALVRPAAPPTPGPPGGSRRGGSVAVCPRTCSARCAQVPG